MITLLCPSRERPQSLKRSIDTLLSNAAHPVLTEVLVYLDDDDLSNYESIPSTKYVRGPRYGYANLHTAISKHLIPLATGRWLFLWNDDAYMKTKHWDRVIEDQDTDNLLFPGHNHPDHELNVFPVIPKKWVDVAGWSKNGANDTWWQVVAKMIDREVKVPIDILHDREDLTGGHKDATRAGNNYDSKTFFNQDNYGMMGFAAGRIYERFYEGRMDRTR